MVSEIKCLLLVDAIRRVNVAVARDCAFIE
jgi:hypothetical protein